MCCIPELPNYPSDTFVMWGDSITDFAFAENRWIQMLQDKYSDKIMVNLGKSGFTTSNYLKFLESRKFISKMPIRPTLIIIGLGANDASCGLQKFPNQCVPIEMYEENLLKLVEAAKAYSSNIILWGPPPVASYCTNRAERQTCQYAEVAKKVAKTQNLHYLNVRVALQEKNILTDDITIADGLHLNQKGEKILFESISTVIDSIISPQLKKDEIQTAIEKK